MAPVRLIIADDHALFRGGLRSLLQRRRGLKIVAEVDTLGALLKVLGDKTCDILLLDLQMERSALGDIKHFAAHTKVIVLTDRENMDDAVTAMLAGASAVVEKRYGVQTLINAIRTVADGSVWMPAGLQAEILKAQSVLSDPRAFTRREGEIARLVATGLRNAEIADRLSITEATVKSHLNRIFEKLEIHARTELVAYAFQNGLVAREDRNGHVNQ
jgi:two-component system NarL family response regulator